VVHGDHFLERLVQIDGVPRAALVREIHTPSEFVGGGAPKRVNTVGVVSTIS
jgi:hypothetical protein